MLQQNQKTELLEKWKPVLDHEDLSKITDPHKRMVTAQILENTENNVKTAMQAGEPVVRFMSEAAPTNSTGSAIDNYDPVLISMLRRSAPQMIAFDVAGVQPMTGPTGLIFAMRARYGTQAGSEAFYNEANTGHTAVRGAEDLGGGASVANTQVFGGANVNLGTTPTGNSQTFNFERGHTTADSEALGGNTTHVIPEMAFDIDKITVTARGRALKGEYSTELAQDLKAIHGLDAEQELAQIISTELLAEINRELIRTIYLAAKPGAQENVTTPGTFDLDTDANGRWSVERFKGLLFNMERDANKILTETRRGRANIVICSSDVASALQMAGILDYNPALQNNVDPDYSNNTFVGVLNGKYKVYIDPYAGSNYYVMGYKGSNPMDAGIFYCPYVPLQMVRAVGENTFQPKIGFKTRYGMVANPFSRGATVSDGTLVQNTNVYYRRAAVANLM